MSRSLHKACRMNVRKGSTDGGAAAAAAAVVLIVVLAIFLYFFFLAPPPPEEPSAALTEAKPIGEHQWVVVVDSVHPSRSLYHYRATMYMGESYETTLEPLTETTSKITFVDKDGNWQLSSDDYFVLECEDGGSYSLEIVYIPDGMVLGSMQWEAGM